MLYSSRDSEEIKGDESKVRTLYRNLQISHCVGKDIAARYTRKGEGRAEEGWVINHPVVSAICTDFSDTLFETILKSS